MKNEIKASSPSLDHFTLQYLFYCVILLLIKLRTGLICVRILVLMVRHMHDRITIYLFIGQNLCDFLKRLDTFYHLQRNSTEIGTLAIKKDFSFMIHYLWMSPQMNNSTLSSFFICVSLCIAKINILHKAGIRKKPLSIKSRTKKVE